MTPSYNSVALLSQNAEKSPGHKGGHCQGAVHDVSLSRLTAQERRGIAEAGDDDWFRSLSFAEAYSVPAAERVCFVRDQEGRIVEACFYREVRRWKFLKEIQGEGRISPGSSAVQHLVATRRPAVIHLPWLTAAQIPATGGWGLTWSSQKMGEDYCIELPVSDEDYLRSLGAKTRKHLPYYVRRIEREWGGDVEFAARVGPQITRELYHRLLDLNGRRMQRRKKSSAWFPEVVEQRWPIVQKSGLLYGVYYQGRLVAGTLSSLRGQDAHLIVLSHDPEYDRLNLGNVVLWLTVKHLIGMRLRSFHLMWGASFYKAQFGGEPQPLFRATGFARPICAAIWRTGHFLQIPVLLVLAGKVLKRLHWYLRQIANGQKSA